MRWTLTATLLFSPLAAHAGGRPIEVAIQLRNLQAPLAAISQAEATVRDVYAAIGIQLLFRKQDARAITVEFESNTAPGFLPGALAYANALSPRGPRVAVFLDRVRESAPGRDFGLVLGHVIAHELAHILGGCPHSATGIMKAHWDHSDIDGMAFGPLRFTREEAALIRAGAGLRTAASTALARR